MGIRSIIDSFVEAVTDKIIDTKMVVNHLRSDESGFFSGEVGMFLLKHFSGEDKNSITKFTIIAEGKKRGKNQFEIESALLAYQEEFSVSFHIDDDTLKGMLTHRISSALSPGGVLEVLRKIGDVSHMISISKEVSDWSDKYYSNK